MEELFKVNINEFLPLRDVVFRTIRDAVLSGRLQPGERLLENNIAESIGVSRTPVREALRMLELEGFVEMIPRKGAMVKVISEKDIRDVLEIRSALEALAAGLAAGHISGGELETLRGKKQEFDHAVSQSNIDLMAEKDKEFHDLIFAAAKNNKLIQIINNLSDQIYRYRLIYLKDQSFRQAIIQEHGRLLEALNRSDAEQAERLAAEHIKNQEKAIISMFPRK